MIVVVEWQQPLPPENVYMLESLIKKDPKMAYAEIQDIMKASSGNLTRILPDCLAEGNVVPAGCPII